MANENLANSKIEIDRDKVRLFLRKQEYLWMKSATNNKKTRKN